MHVELLMSLSFISFKPVTEAHSEPRQIFKKELFVEIVHDFSR